MKDMRGGLALFRCFAKHLEIRRFATGDIKLKSALELVRIRVCERNIIKSHFDQKLILTNPSLRKLIIIATILF